MLLLSTLRLLTLDLDDTLFPCGPVVARANDALSAALAARGLSKLGGPAIQDRIKTVRAKVEPPKRTYTALRKLAIQDLLHEANNYDASPDACFDIWLDERQSASNDLLYPGTVEALAAIRSAHPDAMIGGVTNGRGDCRGMPRIAQFFDFSLSSEEDGVFPNQKPSTKIYDLAIQRAAWSKGFVEGQTEEDGMEELRSSWIHVGDSLVNDVKASHAAGASTVWLNLPEGDVHSGAARSYSTVSAEEATQRKAAAEAAASSGCVGVTIESIDELPSAINKLLEMRGGGNGGGGSTRLRSSDQQQEETLTMTRILVLTAASYGFAGGLGVSVTAPLKLLQGTPPATALRDGLRFGGRLAKVSASFTGVRSLAQQELTCCYDFGRLSEPIASVLGAAAAGAVGATSRADVPIRAAAFVAIAIAFESGAPKQAMHQLRKLGRAFEGELAQRREQFARPAVRLEQPVEGAGLNPIKRIQRLVDGLNAELGHVG